MQADSEDGAERATARLRAEEREQFEHALDNMVDNLERLAVPVEEATDVS